MTYNSNGQLMLTVVAGTSYTGLYAADGSYNVVLTTENTTIKGLHHPCGAYWGTVVGTITISTGFYAIDGSMNIIQNSDSSYSPVYPTGSAGNRALAPNGVDFPYPIFPSTTLAKFEQVSDVLNTTSLPGVMTNAAMSDSPYGSTALLCTFNGNNGILQSTILGSSVDCSGKGGSIRVTYKPIAGMQQAGGALSNFGVFLIDTAGNSLNCGSSLAAWTLTMSSSAGTAIPGRWQTISIPTSAFTGTGNLALIHQVYLADGSGIMRATSGAQMAIGHVDFVPNPRTRAAVIVSADDLYESAFSVLYPILNGVGASGYINGGSINPSAGTGFDQPGRITTAQMTTMLASGWQLGTSCYTSENQAINDGWTALVRQNDYQGARNYVQTNFGRYPDGNDGSYFSNNNYTDQISYPQLKATHRTLRNFLNGNAVNPPIPYGETFPPGDPYNIVCINLEEIGNGNGGSLTWASLQAALDQVRVSGGILWIGMHDDLGTVGTPQPNMVAALNNLVTYCTQTYPTKMELTVPRRMFAPYNSDTLIGYPPVAWTPEYSEAAGDIGTALVASWDAQATSTITLNSSTVASWNDKANQIVASQVTAGNQPLYNATGVNSLPGVFFNGSTSLMSFASTLLPSGTAASTIVAVLKPISTANLGIAASWGSTGTRTLRAVGKDATNHGIYSDGATNLDTTETIGGAFTTMVISNPGGTSPTVSAYVNGNAAETAAYGTPATTTTNGYFGVWPDGTSFPYNGWIMQIRVFNRVLTSSELAKVAGWASWVSGDAGASLPIGSAYKLRAPYVSDP